MDSETFWVSFRIVFEAKSTMKYGKFCICNYRNSLFFRSMHSHKLGQKSSAVMFFNAIMVYAPAQEEKTSKKLTTKILELQKLWNLLCKWNFWIEKWRRSFHIQKWKKERKKLLNRKRLDFYLFFAGLYRMANIRNFLRSIYAGCPNIKYTCTFV